MKRESEERQAYHPRPPQVLSIKVKVKVHSLRSDIYTIFNHPYLPLVLSVKVTVKVHNLRSNICTIFN